MMTPRDLCTAALLLWTGAASAAPTFSVEANTPSGGVLTELDVPWHGLADGAPGSLGVTRTEFDFNGAAGADVTELLTPDGVTASLLGWMFYGWWDGGGGPIYGVVSGGALEAYGSQIEITFDTPVYGLGAWSFDDNAEVENGLSLTITEIDGTEHVSPVLDSGNGFTHRIDGYLGVVSDIGITRAVFDNVDLSGAAPPDCCLIIDHLQVATVTTPSDDDGDGVLWGDDQCPDSAPDAVVGPDGCAAGPALDMTGSCPGAMTVELSGLTPGGQVALFSATTLEPTPTWAGPCLGTVLDVEASSPPRVVVDADGDGTITLAPTLGAAACGRYVQAIDVTTCTTTGVFAL